MKPEKKAVAVLPPMMAGSLWAIREGFMPRVLELARGSFRASLTGQLPQAATVDIAEPEKPASPGVAVISLTGILTPHGSMLSFLFGGGDGGVQSFRDRLARAVANPDVAAIVLDIDSPGGSVGLVPEAAADVRAARDIKPIYAVANTDAASGAYWIASQATEMYATPSAGVGSIGVYYVHEDWSEADAEIGVAVTYIYAGKYKTEGNAHAPLSDEAKAAWQADADAIYDMFVNDVALGRGTTAAKVRSDFGEGRVKLATDALAAGMVDGVETLQTIVDRALAEASSSTGPSARRLGNAPAVLVSAEALNAWAAEHSTPRAETPPEPAPAEPPAEPAEPAEETPADPAGDPEAPCVPTEPVPVEPTESDLPPGAPGPESDEPETPEKDDEPESSAGVSELLVDLEAA